MNNFRIEIDDTLTDSTLIPACKEYNNIAKLKYCYKTLGTLCNVPICDVCLYSRKLTVANCLFFKQTSHLLCPNHYLLEIRKLRKDGV